MRLHAHRKRITQGQKYFEIRVLFSSLFDILDAEDTDKNKFSWIRRKNDKAYRMARRGAMPNTSTRINVPGATQTSFLNRAFQLPDMRRSVMMISAVSECDN